MRTASEIEAWITEYIAANLKLQPRDIRRDATFEQMGLDSSSAIAMVGDLEDWLGCEIDPTLPYDYPTISEFARQLSGQATVAAH